MNPARFGCNYCTRKFATQRQSLDHELECDMKGKSNINGDSGYKVRPNHHIVNAEPDSLPNKPNIQHAEPSRMKILNRDDSKVLVRSMIGQEFGIRNSAGSLNCFLNVILQLFWVIPSFRQSI